MIIFDLYDRWFCRWLLSPALYSSFLKRCSNGHVTFLQFLHVFVFKNMHRQRSFCISDAFYTWMQKWRLLLCDFCKVKIAYENVGHGWGTNSGCIQNSGKTGCLFGFGDFPECIVIGMAYSSPLSREFFLKTFDTKMMKKLPFSLFWQKNGPILEVT